MTNILSGFVWFCLGMAVCEVCVDNERRDAIKAGVAEYSVNKTSGEVAFVYIKPVKLLPVPELEHHETDTKTINSSRN